MRTQKHTIWQTGRKAQRRSEGSRNTTILPNWASIIPRDVHSRKRYPPVRWQMRAAACIMRGAKGVFWRDDITYTLSHFYTKTTREPSESPYKAFWWSTRVLPYVKTPRGFKGTLSVNTHVAFKLQHTKQSNTPSVTLTHTNKSYRKSS